MKKLVLLLLIFNIAILFGCTTSINPLDLSPSNNYTTLPEVTVDNNYTSDNNTKPIVNSDNNILVNDKNDSNTIVQIIPDVNIVQEPKGITLSVEEIKNHTKKSDCWMIINDNVYDLTTYVGHPGGNVYVSYCGTDGTNTYKGKNGGHRHSSYANILLDRFIIGKLGETIVPVKKV